MRKPFTWAIALLSVFITSCGDDENIVPEVEGKEFKSLEHMPSYVVDAYNNAKLFYNVSDTIPSWSIVNSCDYSIPDKNRNITEVDRYGNVLITTSSKDSIYIDWTVREGMVANKDNVNNTVWVGRSEASVNENTENAEAQEFYKILSHGAQYESSTTENEETINTHELSGFNKLYFKNITCLLTRWDTVKTYECKYLKTYRNVNVKEQTFTADNKTYKVTLDEPKNTVTLSEVKYINRNDATQGYYTNVLYNVVTNADGSFTFTEDSVLQNKKYVSKKTWHYSYAYNYRQVLHDVLLFTSKENCNNNNINDTYDIITLNLPVNYDTLKESRIVLQKEQ